MALSRRRLIAQGSKLTAFMPFADLFYGFSTAEAKSSHLLADPAKILDLPRGFSYRILDKVGQTMTTGERVPKYPDGMGAFALHDGTWLLMRNHEIEVRYGGGGVSAVVVDPETLSIKSSRMVLRGTDRNCNGGVSPWGWMSCEESDASGHGYVYLCPLDGSPAQKISSYGRFRHEAVEMEAHTNIAYLTEDEEDSCFYRFVPADSASPFVGQMQALRVVGQDRLDGNEMPLGTALEAAWVNIDDVHATQASLRRQAKRQGAATFRCGEGMAQHDRRFYFTASKGGKEKRGQIFAYQVTGTDSGHLTLVAESTGKKHLDCPDGLTCAPWGDVYIAEDGDGDQYIRVLKHNGSILKLARNAAGDGEFAGLCFSPDGKVLFANLLKEGITLAITGDFQNLA